jgi:hypothetical protein
MSEMGQRDAEVAKAVRSLVDTFRTTWSRDRLRLFRQHLQVTIRSCTPLLSRISAIEGLDPISALWSLRPPSEWPHSPSTNSAIVVCGGQMRRKAVIPPRSRSSSDVCLTLRAADDPRGWLLLRVGRKSIELTGQVGDSQVRTLPGMLYVRMPHGVPNTILQAAVGRPLADLVDHPWFHSTDWTIRRIRPSGWGAWIAVSTGRERFDMPWASLLPRPCEMHS